MGLVACLLGSLSLLTVTAVAQASHGSTTRSHSSGSVAGPHAPLHNATSQSSVTVFASCKIRNRTTLTNRFGRPVLRPAAVALACPFCTALKPTLTEEIETTDAVVFATVLGPGRMTEDGFDRKLRMQVKEILKGDVFVQPEEVFETIAPASLEPGQECLVMGVLTDQMMWSTPMKLTERSRKYILDVQELPLEGPERIRFFLDFLEDPESFMAYDAYDEFARTPYDDVKAIKPYMNRDKLVAWVQDPEVSINRKRLYFTLLGVCGSRDDLPLLERMITSPEKRDRAALDSLVACYLTLAGPEGVALIEDRFLRDKESDYVDTYAAVAALRFHGTESDIIPLPRIVEAVRLLLDRPEVADLVIPDLARWKDWTVTDKLIEMFKNADEKTNWVRVPIVHFLRVNPDPTAKQRIEELREVDPQSVRRALAFFELEASLQSELDEEDLDFERQLRELEQEQSGGKDRQEQQEQKQQGGQAGSGSSSPIPVDRQPERPKPLDREPLEQATVDRSSQASNAADSMPVFPNVISTGSALADGHTATARDLDTGTNTGTDTEAGTETGMDTAPVGIPTSVDIAGDEALTDDQWQRSFRPALPANPGARPAATGSATSPLPSESQAEADYFWWILGTPILVNLVLLALAWSIINGTFSRLFC